MKAVFVGGMNTGVMVGVTADVRAVVSVGEGGR